MLDNDNENIDTEKTAKQFISTNIIHIIELLKQASLNSGFINNKLDDGILKDYYELIKTNITLEKNITYLFHIISREISNSTEENDKKLIMSLLPEFYTPFTFNISLTYPYLSRVLTTIQSNINSNINPNFISEIFSKILKSIFPDNLESFENKSYEICQGFCIYNMKQIDINNQLVGVMCLSKLISESNYYLSIERYIKYLWERIILFCDNENFIPKNILLKCLSNFVSKCKLLFKPFINITLYKLLNFFENKDSEIRKESLNVLLNLITYCPDEMTSYNSLLIDFLNILQKDEVQHIRINSSLILQKIKGTNKLNNNNINSYNRNYFNNINQINNKKKYFFNNVLRNNSTNANTNSHTISNTFSANKYRNNDVENNKVINLKNYNTQKIPTHKSNYLCNSVSNLRKNIKHNIHKESIFTTRKNDNFFNNFSNGIFIKDNYRTYSNGVEWPKNELKNENIKIDISSSYVNTSKNNFVENNNYNNEDLNIYFKNNKKDNRLSDILNELKKMNDRQESLVKAFEGLKNEIYKSTASLKTRINNLEFILDSNKNNN